MAGASKERLRCWKLTDKKLHYLRDYWVPGDIPRKLYPIQDETKILVASLTHKLYCLHLKEGIVDESPNLEMDSCIVYEVIPNSKSVICCDHNKGKIRVLKFKGDDEKD